MRTPPGSGQDDRRPVPAHLIATVPYDIHTVLTDNGIQFTNQMRHKYAFHHIFDRVCDEDGVEHRLTKINHGRTGKSSG